jgi:hypothetical protein
VVRRPGDLCQPPGRDVVGVGRYRGGIGPCRLLELPGTPVVHLIVCPSVAVPPFLFPKHRLAMRSSLVRRFYASESDVDDVACSSHRLATSSLPPGAESIARVRSACLSRGVNGRIEDERRRGGGTGPPWWAGGESITPRPLGMSHVVQRA